MGKEKTEKEGFIEVLIPTTLFEKIEERIKDTEFPSVSDYITYVLRELLSEEEEEEVLSEEDEEKIKARLRALGYIE